MTFIAAAAEPHTGWGHPLALILTTLAFWAFTVGFKRYKQLRGTPSGTPSPASAAVTVTAVKPQLTATVDSENTPGGVSTAVVVRTPPAADEKTSAIDEFVALRLGKKTPTQIVREAKHVLKVSDATAWRAIRRARQETP